MTIEVELELELTLTTQMRKLEYAKTLMLKLERGRH